MLCPRKKVDRFRLVLFTGVFVVGGTVLFLICIKEVPAFPIIKTGFDWGKKKKSG